MEVVHVLGRHEPEPKLLGIPQLETPGPKP